MSTSRAAEQARIPNLLILVAGTQRKINYSPQILNMILFDTRFLIPS